MGEREKKIVMIPCKGAYATEKEKRIISDAEVHIFPHEQILFEYCAFEEDGLCYAKTKRTQTTNPCLYKDNVTLSTVVNQRYRRRRKIAYRK